MKTVVVIPTYDEKDNVGPMSEAVLAQSAEGREIEILFVDDNSPDGTGAAIDALSEKDPRIRCLHRAGKEGLGRAYVAGFRRALELGAGLVVQMDCDFSHNPGDLPRMIEAAGDPSEPSLVIGSRYVKGGSTPGWPFRRRLISRMGGVYIRLVTGMPLRDPTGGFKCWTKAALEKMDLETVESSGYSFQLEMNHRAWKRGVDTREIPIAFTDRIAGYSKISAGIAVESLKIAWRLRFRKRK
ncbi:MAG: polyprenol monophosphomannose synthase [Kiritimatiellae bacterium]|nr:polyprenol monophosphomannose synthase [Kiritimatiellia bacterium]